MKFQALIELDIGGQVELEYLSSLLKLNNDINMNMVSCNVRLLSMLNQAN